MNSTKSNSLLTRRKINFILGMIVYAISISSSLAMNFLTKDNMENEMNSKNEITKQSLYITVEGKGVILRFPNYPLEKGMKSKDTFQGTASIIFPDGETASYDSVFLVLPETVSAAMKVTPQHLIGRLSCERDAHDFIGATYSIDIKNKIENVNIFE